MLFNSFEFLLLLVITFCLYYLPLFKTKQVLILITSSFVFYAYYKPILLILFLLSIFINSITSFEILRSEQIQRKKLLITLGVIFNISLLSFFKYSSLIALTFWDSSKELDSTSNFLLTLPLPIGISFYTFEGISLLIDVFRDGKILKVENKKSFVTHLIDTSFFVSFFPHLIAGPILKAHDFFPQIGEKVINEIKWERVCHYLLLGYFFKMVIADNLKEFTSIITYPYFQGYSSIDLILALLGFSMQIFADFAGYSLIAIGLGLLFGYRLPNNFNFPYISTSFSEFWNRWHISLSTWLKEYLYIPLGGNRKGNIRTYFNLFIVMFLGGLWHGAAWSYALWGGFHGFALGIERFIKRNQIAQKSILRSFTGGLIVFFSVTVLWLFFMLPNFNHVILFFQSLFENFQIKFAFGYKQLSIIVYSLPVVFYHLYYLIGRDAQLNPFQIKFIRLKPLIYSLMLFLILVNYGNQGEFIYFQF